MLITMAKLRMAHASTHGARKPPGPTNEKISIGFCAPVDKVCADLSGLNTVFLRIENIYFGIYLR